MKNYNDPAWIKGRDIALRQTQIGIKSYLISLTAIQRSSFAAFIAARDAKPAILLDKIPKRCRVSCG